jgi:hypothetical protein
VLSDGYALDAEACQAHILHMAMSPTDRQILRTLSRALEQTRAALKKDRAEISGTSGEYPINFAEALAELKKHLADPKKSKAN